MMIVVVILSGIVFAALGRLVFGRWFNHVSLYSGIWAASLTLFEIRLINYYPLQPETWLLIYAGWIAFTLGSVTVMVARHSTSLHDRTPKRSPTQSSSARVNAVNDKLLLTALWILNIVSFSVALYNWSILIRKFGSITNVMIWSNVVYSLRVANEIQGTIPYLDPLALTAALLAGVYTAQSGRLKFAALFSIITVVVIELGSMGRAKIILAAILFLSGYYLNPWKESLRRIPSKISRLRRLLGIVLVVALLVMAAEIIRGHRGTYESFSGATSALERLRGNTLITPSIYLYLTVHHGVFNQYLIKDQEHGLWGGYTFAPIWRVLARLGFDTHVSYYQPFYATPAGANTGTYLREVHADFGVAGVLVFPYLLGMLTSFFWYRVKERKRLFDLVVLGHLYAVVCWTLFFQVSGLGYWQISLIAGTIVGVFVDRTREYRSTNKLIGLSPSISSP